MRSVLATLLLVLTSIVSQGGAMPASDVADAAMHRDAVRLRKLISSRVNVNAPQPDGTTALHWAAYHGDAQIATALLRARANPAAVTETGRSRSRVKPAMRSWCARC
jgi:ankyrin repeat protein